MSRKSKIQYQLSDIRGINPPSEVEINNILRAADEIIFIAGRTMLAKILKGSKDKKILERKLNKCPSYGYYHHKTLEKVTKIIDWMIVEDYLDIDYNDRLPVIIFSSKGWLTYKPIYADELYEKIIRANEDTSTELIEQLKQTNREVIDLLLRRIGDSQNIGFIRFLTKWEAVEVKKVRFKIKGALVRLKSC